MDQMRSAAAGLALLLGCSGPSAEGNVDEASKRMEDLIQSHVVPGEFSGCVLVAKGSSVLFERTYGFADFSRQTPFTLNTRFQIGSTTKQFTAAAVLLLAERGRLSVDDAVRKYLVDAPAAWDKVTLFHLLSNTSGIPNYTDFPDFEAAATALITPQEIIARFKDKPLAFEPGSKWEYSNSGYILLGAIIERVSGKSYGAFIAETLLKPLDMTDTGYDPDIVGNSGNATGHVQREGGGIAPAGPMHMSMAYSAGGLTSTARDMLRWLQGLHGGRVLSEASLKRMTTPYKADYGMGVVIETRYWHFLKMLIGMGGTQMIHHGGDTFGFSNHVAYYPEQKMSVIVLGNIQSYAPFSLARRLATVAFNEPKWSSGGTVAQTGG